MVNLQRFRVVNLTGLYSQGRGFAGKKNVLNAWRSINLVNERIDMIKGNQLNRAQVYDLFCLNDSIPGLGPAYFTKILFFFSPEPNCYIMDQWTTKPVILLTNENVIRHTSQGPTNYNNGVNYEFFCRFIDYLIEPLGVINGNEVEQRLFSVGSIKRQPRGEFRQFVFEQWKRRPKLNRYSELRVKQLMEELAK